MSLCEHTLKFRMSMSTWNITIIHLSWVKICLFFLIHSLWTFVSAEWVWNIHRLDKSKCISFLTHMKRINVKTFLVRLICTKYTDIKWKSLMPLWSKGTSRVTELPSQNIYWSWKFQRTLFIKESTTSSIVCFSMFSWQILVQLRFIGAI